MIGLVISFLMCGMRHVSSKCVGIYTCIISQGISGWLFIFIICRYGEIFAGVGILVTFSGCAYLLWISVSRPPLHGVQGILCCVHLVSACVLLKMSLNSGNRFCMYFIDLFAVNLVSWICMIAVLFTELFIRFCKFGNDVLSDDAFYVIMFVSCSVSVLVLMIGVGVVGSGGGCEYSLMFSRQRSASVIN